MELREWLAVAMFVSFIALLFTGFPVAWVLAGVGIAFVLALLCFLRLWDLKAELGDDVQITQDPAVGVYLDGVYLARSTTSRFTPLPRALTSVTCCP